MSCSAFHRTLTWLRAVGMAVVLTTSVVAGPRLTFAEPSTAPAIGAVVAPEEAAVQARTVSEAYNLLLDHFAHSLDTATLLRAGWDELAREAQGVAPAPGPAPAFTGDRRDDLALLRSALSDYLGHPGAISDRLIAAHAIVRGMVHWVDEGHTYFLDQQQYREYQTWSRGDSRYVGIGISITTRGGTPRIVEVYDDTPARQAGIKRGDVIVSINGTSTDGLAGDQLTGLMRGPVGTPVQVVVQRGDDPSPLSFTITRAEIHVQFVRDSLIDGNVAYVSLRGFPEPSVVEAVEHSITALEDQGAQSLVLDLRGNTGGRIDVGTRLLSHFLPTGAGVYEEVSNNGDNRLHVTYPSTHINLPLVVLVDAGTASMGEIFASAVQEHGAATVLGTPTSGNVAAAQVFPLPDGSALQVTVFDILSSGGKTLNRVGVEPDETIPTSAADRGSLTDDPALARAVDILHAQMGAGSPVSAGRADP